MKLAPRKRQILNLIAEGLTNKEIASKLKISQRTVEAHVSLIIAMFSARNRSHAAILYERTHPRKKRK